MVATVRRSRHPLLLATPLALALTLAHCAAPQSEGIAPPALVGVQVSPDHATLAGGASVQLAAVGALSDGNPQAVSVNWTATGGTVSSGGLYTAPGGAGTYLVVATQQGGTLADTAVITVTALPPTLQAIEIAPAAVTVQTGAQQQFAAVGRLSDGNTQAVTVAWSASGGTVSAGGNYTAPGTAGSYKVIATQQGGTLADTAVVTVTTTPPPPPTLQAIEVTPAAVTLQSGAQQQFSAIGRRSDGSAQAVTVTWSASGGTVSASGNYTAPGTAGSYRVIAVQQGGTLADTATVTVPSPPPTLQAIEVTPAAVTLQSGAQQQFSAIGRRSDGSTQAVTVTWSASGGTVSGSGNYTAPGTAGSYRVIATLQGGTLADTAMVTVTSPPPPGTVDTVFYDGFESGSLSLWQDGVDPAKHRVVTDAAAAAAGNRFLEITNPAGGDGGWLTRFFMPGYDSIYVSYYVKLASSWTGGTKLVALRGSPTNDQWAGFGNAGRCPSGTDFFTTTLVTDPVDQTLFYSYYPGMQREPDGVTCYGRHGDGTERYYPPSSLGPGSWHHLEFWVRLNTPGSANGEQRFWVDGVLKGEWSGLSFRTSTILALNSVQLSASMVPPATQTEHMYVDQVLVTRARPN